MPGVALGSGSYMCPVMQDSWNDATPNTPTLTIAHLRTGNPITPRQSQNPRVSTARIMPGADQLWTTVDLVDFNYEFELNGGTHWVPIFTAAWGQGSYTSAAPNVRTYTLINPPIDGGTDATGPPELDYNHSLLIRQTFATGSTHIGTYEMRECAVNEFTLSCAANETMRMGISGTGQNFQSASQVSFSEPSGTPFGWSHLIAGANSGIYSGTANPPTTAMPVKSFKFTLNHNLRFEPFLGMASGQELKLPTRNGFPTAMCEFEMDFDDVSTTDAVSLMTDYLALTEHNLRIEAYIDANNSLELLASGSTAPSVLDSPLINVGSEGPVGFTIRHMIYPATVSTDLKMVFTTAS